MNANRELTYRFLSLPYVIKLAIANELGLYKYKGEKKRSDLDLYALILKRAKSKGLLEKLRDRVFAIGGV